MQAIGLACLHMYCARTQPGIQFSPADMDVPHVAEESWIDAADDDTTLLPMIELPVVIPLTSQRFSNQKKKYDLRTLVNACAE